MDELAQLLQGLPPEVLQQLMEMSGIQDQMGLQDQRGGMAQQLRDGAHQQFHTPMGAALGGIGNVIGQVGGTYQQGQALDAKGALIDKAVKGRGSYAELLKRKQMADVDGPPPVGINPNFA